MHRVAVRHFMRISFIYAVVCGAIAGFAHPLGIDFMLSMIYASESHWINLWVYMPYICIAVIAAFVVSRSIFDREKMADMGIAFLGCVLFMWGFSMFKSAMPHIVPFWADPLFAQLDRLLHFGRDPWELIDGLRAPVGTEIVDYVYLKLWAWPAIVGPMLLVVFDNNRARVARYLMLFWVTWAFLGNVLALVFMSAGPVYYDRLLGTEEFTALTAVLSTPSEQQSLMGIVRDWLWAVNGEGYEGISSGISAFPSLHVGVATLTCLYLCERSKLLAPFGVFFLGFILFGSVLSGLHYAIDGYASIAVVLIAWRVSKSAWARQKMAQWAMTHPGPGAAQTA